VSAPEDTRRARDVDDPAEASKVQLVTAALYLIGGDSRFVVVDELTVACHRLAPAVFSWPAYAWLPNFDSVRVTLVDARRAELIKEGDTGRGRTLRGVRLSDKGLEWIRRNGGFLAYLRGRLPDPDGYTKLPPKQLLAVALSVACAADKADGASRERLAAEAYRLFPACFALAAFPGWPDAGKVDRALSDNDLVAEIEGMWRVSAAGAREVTSLTESLHVRAAEGFGATERRGTKGASHLAVTRVQESALHSLFLRNASSAEIEAEGVCDLLSVPLEARPEVIKKHLESLRRLVEQADRRDFHEFFTWIEGWLREHKYKLW